MVLGGCDPDSREPEHAVEPLAPSGEDLALRTARARLREAAPDAFADWKAVAAELREAEAAAEAARAEVAARRAEVAEAMAAAEAALQEADERTPAAVAALETALAKTQSAKAAALAAASPVTYQARMVLAEQEARKRLAEAAPTEWARFAAEAGLPEKAEPTALDELDRLREELEP